ncbi:spike base protein, RCAP_Rcc01079 family [Sphingomonas sp. Marseille-Q8236]
MADVFSSSADTVSSPATRAAAITPSDTADLPDIPKGVYVGTGGDITMIGVGAPASATGITWKNVPAGSLIPFRPRRILANGTTASNMLGLY